MAVARVPEVIEKATATSSLTQPLRRVDEQLGRNGVAFKGPTREKRIDSSVPLRTSRLKNRLLRLRNPSLLIVELVLK